jgi:hypothetical protein
MRGRWFWRLRVAQVIDTGVVLNILVRKRCSECEEQSSVEADDCEASSLVSDYFLVRLLGQSTHS